MLLYKKLLLMTFGTTLVCGELASVAAVLKIRPDRLLAQRFGLIDAMYFGLLTASLSKFFFVHFNPSF